MVLVHRFVEVEPNVTEVQLAADAPATLGRKILGPLFVIGARQVMKKALAEDKRDLEQGEFVPGLAAGNVEAALASLAPYEQAEPAVKRAILEAACLISACDGTVDDAERDAIRRAAAVLGASGAETEPTKLLERCAKLAEGEQIKAEIDRVGAELRAADVAHAGVTAAAVIALVSQGMSLGELAALRRLANAAGLPEEKLEPLIANADSELDAS
jgi:tellurite resistance protein